MSDLDRCRRVEHALRPREPYGGPRLPARGETGAVVHASPDDHEQTTFEAEARGVLQAGGVPA